MVRPPRSTRPVCQNSPSPSSARAPRYTSARLPRAPLHPHALRPPPPCGSRGTAVTRGVRARAAVPGRDVERHPAVQRRHPGALMHATIRQRCWWGAEDQGKHRRLLQAPWQHHVQRSPVLAPCGVAALRVRTRLRSPGGCHTGGTAAGLRQTCQASRGDARGRRARRGPPGSMTGVTSCMTASFSLYGGGIPRQRGSGKEYTARTSHPICAWSQPLCYLSHASAQRLLASCTSRSSARSSLQQRAKPVPTGSVFSYGFFFKKLQRYEARQGLPPLRRKMTGDEPQ